MIQPIVLYRAYDVEVLPDELKAYKDNFETTPSRNSVPSDSLVIGRYAVLPYYQELELDLAVVNSKLINSYRQHRYIADLMNWYSDLEEFTPKTWPNLASLPQNEPGSFVLKGETNSRKHSWNTHMFAKSREDVIKVYTNLANDAFISSQSIYIRKFEYLKTYMMSVVDMPVTDEYRFFICDGQILSGAYYWSSHIEDLQESGIYPDVKTVPQDFLYQVIAKVENRARFWVLDVAQTTNGNWIVVELNDGQMSGLSENNPAILFSNLKLVLEGKRSLW